MRWDHYRVYATEAFRYFAKMGRPSYRSLKAQYTAQAMEEYQKINEKGSNISKPTEAAILYAERETDKKEAELRDVLAVERVYHTADHDTKRIIEIVYFESPHEPIQKGDITLRVAKASIDTNNSECTVYRILKAVRIRFAEERGLRI